MKNLRLYTAKKQILKETEFKNYKYITRSKQWYYDYNVTSH